MREEECSVSEKKDVPINEGMTKKGIPINEGLIKKGGVNDAPKSPRPSTAPPPVSPNTNKKGE